METDPPDNPRLDPNPSPIDGAVHIPARFEPGRRAPVRVYRIRTPVGSRSGGETVRGLISLALLTLVLLVSLLMIVLVVVLHVFGPPSVDVGLLVVTLGGLVGSIVGLVKRHRWASRRLGTDSLRYRRLERIAARADAVLRVPHRLIERHWWSGTPMRTEMENALCEQTPGTVIVANKPAGWPLTLAVGCAVPFEPVDVFSDRARLRALAQADRALRESLDRAPGEGSIRHILRRWLGTDAVMSTIHRWSNVLFLLGCLAGLLPFIWRSHGFFVATVVALPVIWWAIQDRPRFRRTWWVPGGVILRGSVFKDVPHSALVTRASSPLLLDLRAGRAHVLVDDHLQTVPCPGWTALCLLSAWLSPVPPPTAEQVAAYLGG